MEKTNEVSKKRPKKVHKIGNVKLNVWENEDKEGKAYNSYTLEQFYSVGEGETKEWKSNSSFSLYQLKHIISLCEKEVRDKQPVETTNIEQ